MMMCHMVSPDLDALHAMADRIRVKRRWFQDPRTMPKVSCPHYDICQSKRALALTAGAVEVDRHQMAAIVRITKNVFFGADAYDPLGHLRNHPPEARERVARWLAGEGWPVTLRLPAP
jgi:hypothetical protein